MSATNDKPPGRPPHKHSKAVPPKPGDEQGAYTRAQLVRFDNRFRSRLCAPSGPARRAVRPPLTRSRLLVGEIIKRSLKLRRCRLSCVTLICCRRPPGVPCGTSEVIMPTANSSASKEVVTAALLVIGGKILSGRTKDQNIGYVAEYLTAVGIDLKEVRVVGDEERAIIDAVNALRHRYTYVHRRDR